MTEQEIEHCLERFTMGKTTDVMNFDYAGTLAYIQRLKAENAALQAENASLHERLNKVAELPVNVGDIVYCVGDEDGDYIVEPTVVTKENVYLLCSRIKSIPSNAFLSQKAAEEWCKELKGERK